MDAILLYEAWKEDKSTENIANLFLKPENSNLLQMEKVYISEIKKLPKNIIIYFKKNSLEYILECPNYLPISNVDNFKCSFYNVDIHNKPTQLKIELKIDDKTPYLIYCLRARITDMKIDCISFI